MEKLRREPFRLLFPLGALLAWIGIAPWVLFGSGLLRPWPGTFHALTMTQAFLLAIAVGFLGTMIPRRSGAPPMSALELVLVALGLAAIPLGVALERLALAELAYLGVVAILLQFAIRRIRRGVSVRPVPPSFLFLPVGFMLGAVGAILLIVFTRTGASTLLAAGRSLVEEGVLLCMVMALTPMLSSIILHDRPPTEWAPHARKLHALAALAFAASFLVQHVVNERAGLLLRGGVVALEMVLAAGLLESPTTPGLHRRLYRLALLFAPLGPLAAGLMPHLRIPCLHLTFVGGFSLMVFAVSFHVTFLHTGREWAAKSSRPVVLAVGALTLAATCARLFAERFSNHYFEALLVASSLWVAAALVWGLSLLQMIARPPRTDAP